MVKLHNGGVYLIDKTPETDMEKLKAAHPALPAPETAKKGTMAYAVLSAHDDKSAAGAMNITFDALASHDITYVNAIQTAKASGLTEFKIPYVLTNCHNSLCAVGGTINEDDHRFGLAAAVKYGGIYVPAHMAVIHQYMRERYAGCGKMILGTDSHTRYGAIGTLGIGEGGGELVKQLLNKPYAIAAPEVILVYLTGRPACGVGAQDIALAVIGAVFKNGFVKNKILEFAGDGIAALSMDMRNGIDVMTTETACLSSIWETDDKTKAYLETHGRGGDYKRLAPEKIAYYDGMIRVALDKIKPMIAMPMHPSNVYTIENLKQNAGDILRETEKQIKETTGRDAGLVSKLENGRIKVGQGIIAGCAGGTFENIMCAADILSGGNVGDADFSLSVYPASQPILLALLKNGAAARLAAAGAVMKTAFCGPCFGAGDVPANQALSIRHTTRNFPHREGSRPADNQISAVALMDARSIAASALKKGALTAADEIDAAYKAYDYDFDDAPYASRVYNGFGKPDKSYALQYGPNITDWPEFAPMSENMLVKIVSRITDAVTTTDELIPSGETSSYRSNPERLSEFTLSRKDPAYVGRSKALRAAEAARLSGDDPEKALGELKNVYDKLKKLFPDFDARKCALSSAIYANKPGDGSAREQAASCQKVLGGGANIAREYATKRYRSNLINWGILPFTVKDADVPALGDYIFIPAVRAAVADGSESVRVYVVGDTSREMTLSLGSLNADERRILLSGCLINDYKRPF